MGFVATFVLRPFSAPIGPRPFVERCPLPVVTTFDLFLDCRITLQARKHHSRCEALVAQCGMQMADGVFEACWRVCTELSQTWIPRGQTLLLIFLLGERRRSPARCSFSTATHESCNFTSEHSTDARDSQHVLYCTQLLNDCKAFGKLWVIETAFRQRSWTTYLSVQGSWRTLSRYRFLIRDED